MKKAKEKEEQEQPAKIVAAKKFADKETGAIYQEGDSLEHLDEKRIEEIKQRGFIKE